MQRFLGIYVMYYKTPPDVDSGAIGYIKANKFYLTQFFSPRATSANNEGKLSDRHPDFLVTTAR